MAAVFADLVVNSAFVVLKSNNSFNLLFSIIEEFDDFEVVVKLKGCLNATVGMDDRVELTVIL